MVQIDRTNTAIVGLDLYTVTERHQSGLVEAIVQEQIKSWQSNPYFCRQVYIRVWTEYVSSPTVSGSLNSITVACHVPLSLVNFFLLILCN